MSRRPRSIAFLMAAAVVIAGIAGAAWLRPAPEPTPVLAGGARVATLPNVELVSGNLTCTTDVLEWDATFTCTNNGEVDTLDWGDGTRATLQRGEAAQHTFGDVGSFTVALSRGGALAVELAPDFSVTCVDGDPLPVYDIVPVDPEANDGQRWDYLYAHVDGTVVGPDDPTYRPDVFSDQWDLVQIDEALVTSKCVAESRALEALGGEIVWTTNHPLATNDTLKGDTFTALRRGTWRGVQAGSLDVTLQIGETYITQNHNVYFRGCG